MSPISSRNSVPPSACSNRPALRVLAPVKAPFSWPNSSDLDEVARYRRHVDGDERSGAALAVIVQRARDQLLAGAGFARNHDSEIGLHQPRQHAIDFLHRRRTSDQRNRFEILDLGGLAGALLRLRQSAADDGDQLLKVERLGQVFVGAVLRGPDCRHERVLRAHDQDRKIGARLFDARQQIERAFVRQQHVGDDQIAVALADPAPQRGGIAGRTDLIAGARQCLIEYGPDRRIVIGDENASRGHQ